jgi:hypothetical protein
MGTSGALGQRQVFKNRSDETIVGFLFANDIFFKTDKYFTNGISLFTYNELLKESPLKWANIKTHGSKTDYYQGLSLISNLYTPQNLSDTGIIYGDRPFTSYLLFGLNGISNNAADHYRLTSDLWVGVLGKSALGKQVQSFGHLIPPNNPPKGWDKQLSNSLAIQYRLRVDYLAFKFARLIEGVATAEANVGMIDIKGSAGYFMRLGILNPYLSSVGPNNSRNRRYKRVSLVQLYLRFGQEYIINAFDATLEGGLIKQQKNQYVLAPNEVKRQLWNYHASLGITVGGFDLEFRGDFLTKQFKGGTDFKWGTIKGSFAF